MRGVEGTIVRRDEAKIGGASGSCGSGGDARAENAKASAACSSGENLPHHRQSSGYRVQGSLYTMHIHIYMYIYQIYIHIYVYIHMCVCIYIYGESCTDV